eukprot:GEZU01028608.1.p1 GENE.GEZU01028608.1~~GEZU01028608.1.p1  ORF type:complete len:141 (+),score=8.96 GEZU01028608.1:61-483(+)
MTSCELYKRHTTQLLLLLVAGTLVTFLSSFLYAFAAAGSPQPPQLPQYFSAIVEVTSAPANTTAIQRLAYSSSFERVDLKLSQGKQAVTIIDRKQGKVYQLSGPEDCQVLELDSLPPNWSPTTGASSSSSSSCGGNLDIK